MEFGETGPCTDCAIGKGKYNKRCYGCFTAFLLRLNILNDNCKPKSDTGTDAGDKVPKKEKIVQSEEEINQAVQKINQSEENVSQQQPADAEKLACLSTEDQNCEMCDLASDSKVDDMVDEMKWEKPTE